MSPHRKPPACSGIRQICRRLSSDERATVAIEFAILAPLMFAVLFGLVAFGTQYSKRIALTYAASEGGRAAVAGLDSDNRQALATAAINQSLLAFWPLIDKTKAAISFPTPTQSGEIVISIAYDDDRLAILPFLPDLTDTAPVQVSYFVSDPSS